MIGGRFRLGLFIASVTGAGKAGPIFLGGKRRLSSKAATSVGVGRLRTGVWEKLVDPTAVFEQPTVVLGNEPADKVVS